MSNDLIITPQSQLEVSEDSISRFVNYYLNHLDIRKVSKIKYQNYLNQFLSWLKNRNIVYPTREHIIEFKQHLIEKELKETTISSYLKAIKRLFEYLSKTNKYENIAYGVKQPLVNTGFKKLSLSVEEAKLLLFSIDRSDIVGKRDYAIITLILHTGLRLIEVCRALKSDVKNEGENTLLYVQGKGHDAKDAFVVLTPSVLFAINDYLKYRDYNENSPLFASHSLKTKKETALSTTVLSNILHARLKEAGFDNPKITPHSLRHTAITLALLSGSSVQEAKEMARHTNINTTLIYAHNINRLSDNSPEKRIEEILNGRETPED